MGGMPKLTTPTLKAAFLSVTIQRGGVDQTATVKSGIETVPPTPSSQVGARLLTRPTKAKKKTIEGRFFREKCKQCGVKWVGWKKAVG